MRPKHQACGAIGMGSVVGWASGARRGAGLAFGERRMDTRGKVSGGLLLVGCGPASNAYDAYGCQVSSITILFNKILFFIKTL